MIPCTYITRKSFNLFSVDISIAKNISAIKRIESRERENATKEKTVVLEKECKNKICWSINEFQLCYIIPFNRIVRFACHRVVHLFLSCSSIVYFQNIVRISYRRAHSSYQFFFYLLFILSKKKVS